jgi:hypothetical protein
VGSQSTFFLPLSGRCFITENHIKLNITGFIYSFSDFAKNNNLLFSILVAFMFPEYPQNKLQTINFFVDCVILVNPVTEVALAKEFRIYYDVVWG